MNDPSDAEFEGDWRALDAAADKIFEEDEGQDGGDPHEHLAGAELIRKFYVKHRRSLEADGIDVTAFLRELAGQTKVYLKAVEAEDKAMDAYLLARANQAEAYAQLTEYEFKILQYFENMSEADWAAVPPEQEEFRFPAHRETPSVGRIGIVEVNGRTSPHCICRDSQTNPLLGSRTSDGCRSTSCPGVVQVSPTNRLARKKRPSCRGTGRERAFDFVNTHA